MDLAGTWQITHTWAAGAEGPYQFDAKFESDGAINVLVFVFYGAWQAAGTGTSSDVSFAITDFVGQTLTVYSGTVTGGNQITGNMSGLAHIGEKVNTGTFTATLQS